MAAAAGTAGRAGSKSFGNVENLTWLLDAAWLADG